MTRNLHDTARAVHDLRHLRPQTLQRGLKLIDILSILHANELAARTFCTVPPRAAHCGQRSAPQPQTYPDVPRRCPTSASRSTPCFRATKSSSRFRSRAGPRSAASPPVPAAHAPCSDFPVRVRTRRDRVPSRAPRPSRRRHRRLGRLGHAHARIVSVMTSARASMTRDAVDDYRSTRPTPFDTIARLPARGES